MVRSFSVGNTRMNYLFTSLFSCDGFVFCLLFVVVVVVLQALRASVLGDIHSST